MSNPFFSLDIGSALLAVFIIAIWLMVVRVVLNMFARVALTILALFVLLWAVGQADDVARIAVDMVNTTIDVTVSLFKKIF